MVPFLAPPSGNTPRAAFLGFCLAAFADHSATGSLPEASKRKMRGSSPRFAGNALKPEDRAKVKQVRRLVGHMPTETLPQDIAPASCPGILRRKTRLPKDHTARAAPPPCACARASVFRAPDQRIGSVPRRGGRVVDRAALEMRSTCKRTGGSNPSLSAIYR